jgi:hypothetical protein
MGTVMCPLCICGGIRRRASYGAGLLPGMVAASGGARGGGCGTEITGNRRRLHTFDVSGSPFINRDFKVALLRR